MGNPIRSKITTRSKGNCYFIFLFFILGSCTISKNKTTEAPYRNWQEYLGDKARTHYSALDQIDTTNVKSLQKIWTYQSGDLIENKATQMQCSPIVVDTILYGTNPLTKLFAIHAETGASLWKFDPAEAVGPVWWGVNRGLNYWDDNEDGRIVYTSGNYIYAVDALTGTLEVSFGNKGKVDLRAHLGRPAEDMVVIANTPGVIHGDILIQGSRVHEGPGASPGHIRAYNLRTGALVWRFNTIPHPGEFGYDTWPEDAWKYIGGANSWAGMTLDEETGIVYIPTGSASYDFYGGNRKGKNLFANTLLALQAETGERVWHYQFVHHDLWDRDLPAPPNLIHVKKEGKTIPAIAQITKSGHVFVFDRKTGEPVFPIEEVPVAPALLQGEHAWPTQPLPTKIPPFARQEFTEDLINDMFPDAKALLAWTPDQKDKILDQTTREVWEALNTKGQFIPHSDTIRSVTLPGLDGGAEWGGAGYDPNLGWLIVNSNEMPWVSIANPLAPIENSSVQEYGKVIYQQQCARCHGGERGGNATIPSLFHLKDKYNASALASIIKNGKGSMMAVPQISVTQIKALSAYLLEDESILLNRADYQEIDPNVLPYSVSYFGRFLDENGYPAIKPPWGTLNAIDLNKGELVWQVPLGEYEELSQKGFPKTGTENYGGPIVTAGGLIFIGATNDEYFRAFNIHTGEEIWKTKLPAGGYATPITYKLEGKQYIVIACGGGKMATKSGDTYVAFALPEES